MATQPTPDRQAEGRQRLSYHRLRPRRCCRGSGAAFYLPPTLEHQPLQPHDHRPSRHRTDECLRHFMEFSQHALDKCTLYGVNPELVRGGSRAHPR